MNARLLSALSGPSSPDMMMRRISMTGGLKPSVWPQSSFTPFFAAAFTIASASCMFRAIGFSETACLPAFATSTTCGAVEVVRRRDPHGLDVRVGAERLCTVVHAGIGEAGLERRANAGVRVRRGHQFDLVQALHAGHDLRCADAHADDAHLQGSGRACGHRRLLRFLLLLILRGGKQVFRSHACGGHPPTPEGPSPQPSPSGEGTGQLERFLGSAVLRSK